MSDPPPHRALPPVTPPRHSLLAFLLTLLLFSTIALFTLAPPTRLLRRLHRLLIRPLSVLLGRVPLPPALQTPSDLAVAIRSFAGYQHSQQLALDKKWLAYESMPKRHRSLGDKLAWRETLARAEDAVERNARVTDELAALGLELARKEGIPYGLRSMFWRENGRVVETLKHFVRDWSEEGKSEREALFPPILDALRDEFPARERKVLVPGCGLGRLAYEIASLGFGTSANDFSHFMNLGSSLIFTRTHVPNQHSLSPYMHSFSHHREAENLLRVVSFPDVVPSKEVKLQFEPGDFLSLFPEKETFDAIVTLFFIDTASNLLDYFETIWRLLVPGGIWVNEGPLLYYGNPGMELPLEDVVRLAELVGFQIEKRKSLKQLKYTGDDLGMYTFAYDCEFWVARKPLSSDTGTAQKRA
ncbi:hypothetical protein JCM1841_003305 [Sporobolomyces salmonicolor]